MKVLEPEMIFPGERIVHTTGYHWIYVLRSFLPLLVILVGGTIAWSLVPTRVTSVVIMIALIASLTWIAIKILDTMVKRCYVTNRRLINRRGWTNRDTQDVTLERIGGIFLDQTPFERFLGYGRVKLMVPLIEITLPEYLRNPIAFRKSLYGSTAEKEKPDDEELIQEHERQTKEEDDRFGADTVSLKELQQMANDPDGVDLGVDLGAEMGVETTEGMEGSIDDAALAEVDTDAAADTADDGGADGSEST